MFQTLRLLHGQQVVKLVRRFITTHINVERQSSHLYFNHRCKEERLISPALRVKPLFQTTSARRVAWKQTWQNLGLRISNNHEIIKKELHEMIRLGTRILNVTSEEKLSEIIEFAKEAALRDGKMLQERHERKLEQLRGETKNCTVIDRSRWVKNLSSKVLSDDDISILQKGLNFAITSSFVPKLDIVSEIEGGISNLSSGDKEIIRVEVSKALKSYRPPKANVTRKEREALKQLKNDESIVILKADKGNCTVVLDSDDYCSKMRDLLEDRDTYETIRRDPVKKIERDLNSKLLKLKREGKFSESNYFRLRSTDGIIPRIYGLVKIHKEGFPLRPIVSMIGSPLYEVSKHLASIIAPLVGKTNFVVKNSMDFIEVLKTCSWSDNDVMVSFDVVNLFTSVPVNLAVNILKDRLLNDNSLSERTDLLVEDLVDLVDFCLKCTDFVFRGEFYHQRFGCAMGNPISALVANIVMEELEARIFSNNCVIKFWKRFVDDIWAVLPKEEVETFLTLINGLEASIKFTFETETNRTLPFLDVNVHRTEDGKFSTSVFRKVSQTNRYLDFQSNHPLCHKLSVVRSLTDRAYQFSSTSQQRNSEVNFVKDVLSSNNYPKSVLDRVRTDNRSKEEKTTRSVVIPYVKGLSEKITRVLRPFQISTFYKPINKISTILGLPKDPVKHEHVCGVVYQVNCRDCEKQYIGQTTNSLATRLKQHRAACQHLQVEKSALAEHAVTNDHAIDWANAKVIHRETRWRQRLFAEAIHTKQKGSIAMNRAEMNLPPVYLSVL